jgi:hypothetical protein
LHERNVTEARIQTKKTIIFQFLDDSFFEVWVNWWAVASYLKVFTPGRYRYHLACIGNDGLNEKVKLFQKRGCDDLISDSLISRVYYYRWISFVNAFIRYKTDIIQIDIDAYVIREPSLLFAGNKYDLVGSRDHGHNPFPYGEDWGSVRICNGFMYFRYNENMKDILLFVQERIRVHGQGDQISLNNILARSGVVWNSNKTEMSMEDRHHTGEILWHGQQDIDFLSSYAVNKTIDLRNVTFRLNVKVLTRFEVLRYCSQELSFTKLTKISVNQNTSLSTKETVALHCFMWTGPLGEYGAKKANAKVKIIQQYRYWILSSSLQLDSIENIKKFSFYSAPNNYGLLYPATRRLFLKMTDMNRAKTMKNIWLK